MADVKTVDLEFSRDGGKTWEKVGAVKADNFEALALWDADPECTHDEQPQASGGVKCVKCGGWFCF